MRISVHMDNGWTGDFPPRDNYDVEVEASTGAVHVTFTYRNVTTSPRGGRFTLPASVADRVARAMQTAAGGPLKTPVSFEVDETKIV